VLTPFVGREEELRLLLSRWERTRQSEGQLALVMGEPGIGKSRLVKEFHDRIRDDPHIWTESAGEQFFENTPFHAVIEMLSRSLELQHVGNTEEQFERLEQALTLAGLGAAESAPLIADLLQLPAGERYPASALSAEQKCRRLLAALSGWVLGSARGHPLVMVVEDLHWLDPSSLELLQLLGEQGATAPLMLLSTTRPEFRAPWPMRAHHSQITLARLSSHDVHDMVALVTVRNALASETVDAVVERTGGIPLFVEELTRAVLESGSTRSTVREIPATLHDSLMARLDRLGPAKETIQIGAVIGSEFSYALLQAVHPIAGSILQSAIRKAADAELVYVREVPPDAIYQFKHALIRDTAYAALLKSRRRELHSRVAEVLVEKFPDIVTSAPQHLAHHYTEANLIEQAIPYWQRAGQNAIERSANVEAIAHLSQGLELLKILPDTRERAQQELALQLALGAPLITTKGYAAPEVEQTYLRARELCQEIGERTQLFHVLVGLQRFYLARPEMQIARQLGEECLTLARRAQDSILLEEAHRAMGTALYRLGEFVPGRAHLEQSIALHDLRRYHARAYPYGLDPGVFCSVYLAWALWFLGFPDQALWRSHETLKLAQELSNPLYLSGALIGSTYVHVLRGEREAVQERAETAIALTSEQSFAYWLSNAVSFRGWAIAERGQHEAGIAQMREGVAAYLATGANVTVMSDLFCLLAEVCMKAGRLDDALSAANEAVAAVDKQEERHYEADVHRVKGEVLLRQDYSNIGQAEKCFRRAIEIARQQSGKSLELRATTSLARLLASQGRREEARTKLAEVYSWFTEGFDTADLKEAKQLLEQLVA
jgi:predicted ATPase